MTGNNTDDGEESDGERDADEDEQDEEEAQDESLFAEQKADVRWPMLRLFVEYGRDHPAAMALGLASNVVGPLLGLIPGFMFGFTLNAVVHQQTAFDLPFVPAAMEPAGRTAQLLLSVGIIAGSFTLSAVVTWAGSWGWSRFAQVIQHEIRTDTYDELQRLGMEFFTSNRTGQLLSIVNSDVNQLSRFLNGWLGRILQITVQVVGIGVVMLLLNWQLALFALVPVPVLFAMSYKFRDVVRPKYQEMRQKRGSLNARVENSVGGIKVVKSYTNEPEESRRVEDASEEFLDANWNAITTRIKFFPSLQVVTGYGFAVVFVVGGIWVIEGPPGPFTQPLLVGTFVTFLYYIRQFTTPLAQAGNLLNQYEEVNASAERVFALKDYPVDVAERDDAVELDSVEGRVEYDGVTFRYEDEDETAAHALSDVSFEVEPGDYVGVVGPTGAGKSTVMKLLLRFYDPDEGAVRLDGHDLRDLDLTSLREAIGYVSQEPFLFHGSVADNIAYGKPDVDEADVREAARRAGAHEFVTDLDDGYDTTVGERGVKLSGGQRQRIAIARAVLKDPEILVLDEATSHVDNETEVLIQRSLEDVVADRTTFAIAHRLSTVRNADHIVVLEDGEVAERGTHDDLLDADGLYANLWKVQVGEVESLPESFVARERERADTN